VIHLPPLPLTQERVQRLLTYIQEYRRLVLTQLAPSQERNTQQRLLQALQGKLLAAGEREQQGALSLLSLTSEEVNALQTMVLDLRARKAREPATPQRDRMIVDLSALKVALEQVALCGPKHRLTQRLA
jgi:hypothetical protein